jgi:hypothetical protein
MRSEFYESVESVVKGLLAEIHTIKPGKIISYNKNTGLATIQPSGKYQTPDGRFMDYPQCHQVPVWLFEDPDGQISVSRPIKAGQGCVILFAETSLDDWYYKSRTSGQLRFDLTNAICIPGLFARPSTDTKEAIDGDAVIIRNGDSKFKMSKTTLDITVSGNVNINCDTLHVTGAHYTFD